ncbi:hypothetical protein KCP78_16135 [Salmonella enterica subsp. enterica]|nr:hypothetical protein KCP78_16135 [Salmonella enterica subsp. enterica]
MKAPHLLRGFCRWPTKIYPVMAVRMPLADYLRRTRHEAAKAGIGILLALTTGCAGERCQ